jgi:glycosyltransferase involved in cell wall biosynthesis
MLGGPEWIGGIYYTRNLVSALKYLSEDERPNVTLFVNGATQKEHYKDLLNEFTKLCLVSPRKPVIFVRSITSRVLGSYKYRAFCRAIRASSIDVLLPLLNAPERKLPVRWIGWIPDFQHLHLSEMFSADEVQRRSATYRRLADKADMMIFSSRNCEADFDKFYLHNKVRRKILSFCAILNSDVFERDVQVVKRKYHLPEKFLFLPNQFWKHKNHITVFKAVKILKDRGLNVKLYCSGNLSDRRNPEHLETLRDYITNNNLRGDIVIIGLLPRDDQLQMMRLATALVQPSLFEGWSTVIEEGKSLGKIMYISDLPVNKEQNASGAIYFERKSAEDLADKIQSTWNELKPCPDLLTEEKLRYENPLRYERFARNFLRVIEDV